MPGTYQLGVAERSLAALRVTMPSGVVSVQGAESIVAPAVALRGGGTW